MKKQLFLIGIAAFLFFIFFSCSSEKKEYKNIISKNTISAYTEFIKGYSNSVFIDSIFARIINFNREEIRENNTIRDYREFLAVCGGYQWDNKALRIIGELYYKEVEAINTFPAYMIFLSDSIYTYTDTVEQQMQNLKLLRHPKLQRAESAKLILTTKFPGEVGKELEKTIRRAFTGIAISLGLTRICDSIEDSDFTLKINIIGRGLGTNYSNIGMRFTNAEISGNISITTSDNILERKSFKARMIGPYRINSIDKWGYMKEPKDAPFNSCLYVDNSVIPSMMEMLVKHFGYPTLIGTFNNLFDSWGLPSNYEEIIPKNNEKAFQSLMATLKNQTRSQFTSHTSEGVYKEFIKDASLIYLLGEMKDSRAIKDIMISCPRYTRNDESLKKAKLNAIQKITGDKFKDYNELERWWEEEKAKLNK